MRRLLCLSLLLAALAAPGHGGSSSPAIDSVKHTVQALQQRRDSLQRAALYTPVDVRGRREIDDFMQYAFPKEIESRIDKLLGSARKGGSDAQASLDQARLLADTAQAIALKLQGYFLRVPGTPWREHWRLFAAANGLATASPAQLADAEKALLELLAAGDFERAASEGVPRANTEFNAAIQQATKELAARDPAQLKFISRSTPCAAGKPTGSQKAAITRAASPEDYYPPGSIRRAEEGDIVLRAEVQPDNCANAVAIVVSSGFPDLDAAALKVFEATSFAAGTENGVPIQSHLTFKIKFELKD